MLKRPIMFFAIIGAGLCLAPSAMATQWTTITNFHSGLCMGVQGGVMNSGVPIIQWACDGSANQLWLVPTFGDRTTNIKIVNGSSPNGHTFCLAVADGVEGSQLVIDACSDDTPSIQAWHVRTVPFFGFPNEAWVLTNVGDGYVAAVSGGSLTEGTGIIQWENQTAPDPSTDNTVYTHTEQQWVWF